MLKQSPAEGGLYQCKGSRAPRPMTSKGVWTNRKCHGKKTHDRQLVKLLLCWDNTFTFCTWRAAGYRKRTSSSCCQQEQRKQEHMGIWIILEFYYFFKFITALQIWASLLRVAEIALALSRVTSSQPNRQWGFYFSLVGCSLSQTQKANIHLIHIYIRKFNTVKLSLKVPQNSYIAKCIHSSIQITEFRCFNHFQTVLQTSVKESVALRSSVWMDTTCTAIPVMKFPCY